MAFLWKEGEIQFVDRSLRWLMTRNRNIPRDLLLQYAEMLISCGVDVLEVPFAFLEKAGQESSRFPLVVRVENYQELEYLPEGISKALIPWKSYGEIAMRMGIAQRNLQVVVSCRLEELEEMNRRWKLLGTRDLKKITQIRLTDFDFLELRENETYLKRIQKEFGCVPLGVAPGDRNGLGTGVVFQMFEEDTRITSVTGSFAGGYPVITDLAWEEIMAGVMARYPSLEMRGNPATFAEVRELYEILGKVKISGEKPVIGRHIFHYESAIHADGILKNPATYEPFSPESVGQVRSMFLGKHSGIKSIEARARGLSLELSGHCLHKLKHRVTEESLRGTMSCEDGRFLELVQEVRRDNRVPGREESHEAGKGN